MQILIISYFFPPFNCAGSVRTGSLAAYLSKRGHKVSVLTCSNPCLPKGIFYAPQSRVRRIAVPDNSVNAPFHWLLGGSKVIGQHGYDVEGRAGLRRCIGRLVKLVLHWPDGQSGWVLPATQAGRKLIQTTPFDIIFVSAPPFSGLRIGATLWREFSIPWVAEFRDLWTENHAYSFPFWRKKLEKKWEKSLLAGASALVSVSKPLCKSIKGHGIPVWEVRNGYEKEDKDAFRNREKSSRLKLQIAYTGTLYPGFYELDVFFKGIKMFVEGGGKLHVTACGRNLGAMEVAARQYRMQKDVQIMPLLPRNRVLSLQKKSDILLLFLWKEQKGIFGTKVFEYLGSRRRILAIGKGDCDVGKWIRRQSFGGIARNAKGVADTLNVWAKEKKLKGELLVPKPKVAHTRAFQFNKLEKNLKKLLSNYSRQK